MFKKFFDAMILITFATCTVHAFDKIPAGEGVIVNKQGAPVSGATVRVFGVYIGDNSVEEVFKTTSNDKGEFTLQSIAPAKRGFVAAITASHPDFGLFAVDESRFSIIMPTSNHYQITLPEKGMLRGVVQNPSGEPVPNCRVAAGIHSQGFQAISTINCFLPGKDMLTTMTAADGTFTIDGLPNDKNVFLLASHPDFAPALYGLQLEYEYGPPKFTLKPGDTNITFTLAPGGQIAGTVSARVNGKPVEGAQIVLQGPSMHDGIVAPAIVTSDKDARYLINHLLPGYYSLCASIEGMRSAAIQVKIPENGNAEEQSIILETLRTVSGKVVNQVSGKPFVPDEVTVYVTGERDYQPVTSPVTEDGSFTVSTIPGLLNIRLSSMLGRLPNDVEHKIVLPPDADRTDIILNLVPYPCFKGRVLDEQGKPVAGAIVTYKKKETKVTSDSDGSFCVPLRDCFEGYTYVICAIHPQRPEFRGITSVTSEGSEGVQSDVVLKGTGTIHGRVVDEEGKPVQNAQVTSLYPVTHNYRMYDLVANTNELGEYAINGLIEGVDYQIHAQILSDETMMPIQESTTVTVTPQQNRNMKLDDLHIKRARSHTEKRRNTPIGFEE